MRTDLSVKPTKLRANPARGIEKGAVDREGGYLNAGLIKGVSLTTRGEALGHGRWLDHSFINAVEEYANDETNGLKVRFSHPSASSDGTGKYVGKIFDAYLSEDGNRVLGDLHIAPAAHKSPDGNLAEWLFEMAENNPEAFGLSIVFESDPQAEADFYDAHTTDSGEFQSPDAANEKQLPHVRLSKLRAADVVDDPAANPEGLFQRNNIAQEATDFLLYALELSDDIPTTSFSQINPERARQFIKRFERENNIQIKILKESDMDNEKTALETATVDAEVEQVETQAEAEVEQPESTDDTQTEAQDEQVESVEATDADEDTSEPTEQPTAETEPQSKGEQLSEGQRFLKAFGDQGGVWFAQGLTFDEAQQRYTESLEKRVKELESKVSTSRGGEAVELSRNEPKEEKTLTGLIKESRSRK